MRGNVNTYVHACLHLEQRACIFACVCMCTFTIASCFNLCVLIHIHLHLEECARVYMCKFTIASCFHLCVLIHIHLHLEECACIFACVYVQIHNRFVVPSLCAVSHSLASGGVCLHLCVLFHIHLHLHVFFANAYVGFTFAPHIPLSQLCSNKFRLLSEQSTLVHECSKNKSETICVMCCFMC